MGKHEEAIKRVVSDNCIEKRARPLLERGVLHVRTDAHMKMLHSEIVKEAVVELVMIHSKTLPRPSGSPDSLAFASASNPASCSNGTEKVRDLFVTRGLRLTSRHRTFMYRIIVSSSGSFATEG